MKDHNKQLRSLTESVNNLYNKKSVTEQIGNAEEWGWQHLADIVSNWGLSTGDHGDDVWDSPPWNGISGIEDILWLLDHWGQGINSATGIAPDSQARTRPTMSARPQRRPQSPFGRER
jgi:hypothetical protein